jgi:ribonucleotide monophosphatase NagD (HAD superfamily)
MVLTRSFAGRAIPYVLITNGGGVPDEDRRKALSSELGHEVSIEIILAELCMTSMMLISFDHVVVHCFIALGRSARSVTHPLEAVGQTVCRQARLVSRRKGGCNPQNRTIVSSRCDALSNVRSDGSFSLT